VSTDAIGLLAVLALILLIGGLVAASRLPRQLKLLLYAGLALRVVGATARLIVLFDVYRGRGDAVSYYDYGVRYAERFTALDFSPFWDTSQWVGSSWRGTQFMHFPSGIVVSIIGHTMLGEFIIFSLLSFAGLVAFVAAYHRAYPSVPASRYARWVWLFPSLWFWPSSVGKESITLLGFGLVTLGFVGKHGRVQWLPCLIGLFLIFAIRPQVAAVVLLAVVLAQWLSAANRWTVGRAIQALLILVIGSGAIWYSMRTMGVGSFDAEGVQSYIENDKARRVGGNSAIDAVSVSPGGVVTALVNVLFRPFPWEASNPMVLLSSIEIWSLWVLALWRRRAIASALRQWRTDRLLSLSLPLIGIYAVTLGLMMTNLAIIARQRIFLFPFVFVLLEAVPRARAATARVMMPVRARASRVGERDVEPPILGPASQ
jgi:hypothetical protein